MRVQPHLPSKPFTATVTERSGRARLACSAAKRPAPPLPRMRMSVRARLMPAARGAALRARLERPQPSEVGRAVASLHFAERLHGALLLPGAHLRFAQQQLRIVGAAQAAFLDALLDEGDALARVAFVDVIQAHAHEVVAVLGRESVGFILGAVLLALG